MSIQFKYGILILIASLSCSSKEAQNESDQTKTLSSELRNSQDSSDFDYDKFFNLESYLVNEEVDTSKIQSIAFDCAILVYPTDEQIDEMKKKEGEENFFIGADDSNWYQAQAIQCLDSVGIVQQSCKKQFVKFIGLKGEWILDIRRKNMPAWNLILFQRNKLPEIVSTVSLTTAKLKDYFEIKEKK
jgi:hypothetical protein